MTVSLALLNPDISGSHQGLVSLWQEVPVTKLGKFWNGLPTGAGASDPGLCLKLFGALPSFRRATERLLSSVSRVTDGFFASTPFPSWIQRAYYVPGTSAAFLSVFKTPLCVSYC